MAQDYKKAQIQGTASTGTYATLYTTPAGKQALISTILVCNTDVNNPVTVRVGFDDTAGTPDTAQGEWLVYDAVVAAGDTLTLSLGISMDQQKFLRVSSSNTNANFTAFVVEIGASGNSILPAFLVTNGTARTDVTGDNTVYSYQWDAEVFDRGSDWASDTFTAPVTGLYQMNVCIYINDIGPAFNYGYLSLVCSNRSVERFFNAKEDYSAEGISFSCLVDMDAADTAYVTFYVQGGTKTVDVYQITGANHWSGYLVA